MTMAFVGRFLRMMAVGALATVGLAHAAPPPGYCDVQVCNKLERVTFSPWNMVKDRMGETCMPALLAKPDAVAGKMLNSSSRWYQGSFNPTKSSVTRVKSVGACTPEAPAGVNPSPSAVPAAAPAK